MTTLSTSATRSGPGDAPVAPGGDIARVPLGRVFLAMVFKEGRELAVVLGLVAAGYGAVLALQLWGIVELNRNFRSAFMPAALNSNMMCSGIVIAALAGLLVGFVQFIFDSRPERFGFVTHRPVSRSMIFGCKVAAGLALYFVALAIPLFLALLWASSPRHIPFPFSWRMALAPLADIFSGVPYYFAGILVARRTEARWHGSRLLPYLAPIIASVMDLAANSFGGALLWSAVATVIIGAAAHGYFVAGGQYPRLRRHARVAMGLVLLTGILTAGVLGLAVLATLAPARESNSAGTHKNSALLADGTPVVVTWGHNDEVRIEDLSGKTLGTVSWGVRPSVMPFSFLRGYAENPDFEGERGSGQLHDPAAYFSATALKFGNAAWFRSTERLGGDYLVGFDVGNRRRVGAIGAKGLERFVSVPAARFGKPVFTANVFATPASWSWSGSYALPTIPGDQEALLAAGDTVYRLRDTGGLETFYAIPDHQTIVQFFYGVIGEPELPNPRIDGIYHVVVTDDAVRILSAKGNMLVHYAMAGLSRYGVQVGYIAGSEGDAGGRFVVRLDREDTVAYPARPADVVYFKADGTLDHKIELPLFDRYSVSRMDSVEKYIGMSLAPPAGIGLNVLANAVDNPHFAQETAYWREAMVSSGAGGVVAAAAAFLLARRRRVRPVGVWLWTMLALLTGPAGFLLMVCLGGLPVTVRCATCQRPRPITADVCPNCGTAQAAPARKGTEIFT